jgi:transposase-like protein
MCTVPKPYPREFREDVVRVARGREPGVRVEDIAKDFGISASCLTNWLAAADVEDGVKPGTTADNAELRAAKRRIRLLEQENEVLRRAAARTAQGQTCRV